MDEKYLEVRPSNRDVAILQESGAVLKKTADLFTVKPIVRLRAILRATLLFFDWQFAPSHRPFSKMAAENSNKLKLVKIKNAHQHFRCNIKCL